MIHNFKITESWKTKRATHKIQAIESWRHSHFSSFTVAVGDPFESGAITHCNCGSDQMQKRVQRVTVAVGTL